MAPTGWGGLPEASRRVLLRLLRHGPASRSRLAEELGFSPATMTRMVMPLLRAGLVREGAPRAESAGRPSVPLEAVPERGLLVGVSITSSSVVVLVTDLRAEVLASRVENLEVGRAAPPERVVAVVARLWKQLRQELGAGRLASREVLAMGVCLGANVADGRTVLRAPFLGWQQVPLADLLEEAVGLPTRLENDLAALARAELWFGAGLDCDRFVVVTVGLGTGYALVVDQKVIQDADFGHGLLTDALLQDWPDFTSPGALVGEAAESAARRVGWLIGTASAFTMPQLAVLSGEGVSGLLGHEATLARGVRDVRHPLASELPVRIHQTDFAFWARGAATSALSWVAGEGELG